MRMIEKDMFYVSVPSITGAGVQKKDVESCTKEELVSIVKHLLKNGCTTKALVESIHEPLQQAFWEACKAYGKVGECVYVSYKTRSLKKD